MDASPDDTLASVFVPSALQNGTVVEKRNGGGFVTYTYSGGSWSGNPTLAPGEGAFLVNNPADNPLPVTFVGLVRQGQLSQQIGTGESILSSQIPMAGGISSVLGLVNTYDPVLQQGSLDGDQIFLWTGHNFEGVTFDSTMPTGFGDASDINPVPEPQIAVGQAFAFINSNGQPFVWQQSYSANCSLPTLSHGQVSGNTFSFNINGIPNAYWNIYESEDLNTWTLVSGITLNGNGAGAYTDNGINGTPPLNGAYQRFYKLSSGLNYTQPYGFVLVTVGPGTQTSPGPQALIANPLDALPDNTLVSVFAPTAPPDGAVVMKYNGSGYSTYKYNSFYGDGAWQIPGSHAWMGNPTLAPGDGAFLVNNPAGNPLPVTFVGSVRQGRLSQQIGTGKSVLSSQIPVAGGVSSVLGLTNPYDPVLQQGALDGDQIFLWNGHNFDGVTFDSTMPTGFGDTSDNNPVREPQIAVGQAFVFINSNGQPFTWRQSYPASQ